MIHVLIYLFEHYMIANTVAAIDQHDLEHELTRAGFNNNDITQALHWLATLVQTGEQDHPCLPMNKKSIRVYNTIECTKLNIQSRGLLLLLEQQGILDPLSREWVIESVLATKQATLSVDELKWIILLVLMNRPGHEQAFTQMEDFIYRERSTQRH
jgi:Smg protein